MVLQGQARCVCVKDGLVMCPVLWLIPLQTRLAGEEPTASARVSGWCQVSSPTEKAVRGGSDHQGPL